MIICRTVEEMMQLGRDYGEKCRGGEVFALSGPLGAGKTHWVKGLALGLGYKGEVTSPSYTLIHEYLGGRLDLVHADFYRLEDAAESRRLGFDDYFGPTSVVAIEWPERVPEMLPLDVRWLELVLLEEGVRGVIVKKFVEKGD